MPRPSAPDDDADGQVRRLRELAAEFAVEHAFAPGQLVVWKQGLRNRVVPGDGEAAVVIATPDAPMFDRDADAGSPYFMEPLDLVIGALDEVGDLVVLHVDHRRFEPRRDSDEPG